MQNNPESQDFFSDCIIQLLKLDSSLITDFTFRMRERGRERARCPSTFKVERIVKKIMHIRIQA